MSEALRTSQWEGYEAAKQSAAFRLLAQAGFVLLTGETREDYLQRQTSNDLSQLSAHQAVPNILPSPSGRILDVFTCIQTQGGIALLTPPHRGPGIAEYFQKRVFFNDQVEVQDQSREWAQFALIGPQADEILRSAFKLDEALEHHAVGKGEVQDGLLQIIRMKDMGAMPHYTLLAEAKLAQAIREALKEAGLLELKAEEFELTRIENCVPGVEEFSGEYTPFELGLHDYVSDTKGCYTGQEVLARQVTYDKVTKELVRIKSQGALKAGAAVRVNERTVGKLSSVAAFPSGEMAALAVVRKSEAEQGEKLSIEFQGQSVAGEYWGTC